MKKFINSHNNKQNIDEFENDSTFPRIRNFDREKRLKTKNKKMNALQILNSREEISRMAEESPAFEFSYNVQRDSHEKAWLIESLEELFHQGWLSDVIKSVKGGKEASVYLCKGTSLIPEEFLAAKIYRPRMFRNLRNDSLYREGRADLDSEGKEILSHGPQRAIKKKTVYGRKLTHTSWLSHEFKTMQILYSAGVDMPTPYARGENAILMQYIGSNIFPAPTLNGVDLDQDEAEQLFHRCIYNLEIMLAHNRIHGDYSAYNILYWEDKIWIIDFPQAINPEQNRNAHTIFHRDVERICDYFKVQGIKSDHSSIAEHLWEKHLGKHVINFDPNLLPPDEDNQKPLTT